MKIKNYILDILFPKKCIGCDKEGKYICKNCELFMVNVSNYGKLISFWEYNGVVKKAIRQIKYSGTCDIIRELVNKKEFEIRKDTIITFVPMYIKKEKERGFNQAEIIAKELGKKAGMLVMKLLEKVKETPEQAKLDREGRLKNLQGCFKLAELTETRSLLNSRDRVSEVLLVDDVYTTGATMEECSRTLHKAGFRNINYFTIAKTV